jgi:undecaprenyl-diphosphatase
VSVGALAACAKIGEDVFNHESAPFDEPIRDFVLAHQDPAARRCFLVVTQLGAPRVVIPSAALVAGWFWRRRNLPIAAAVVMAPAVASTLFLAIKRIYRRARPPGGAPKRERSSSFPSGHATASAAVFGSLAHVLWREKMVPRQAAVAMAVVPPLLIGSSRVYLDKHWATDVLGGWSLGALVAALSGGVYERVRRKTREEGVPAPGETRLQGSHDGPPVASSGPDRKSA